MFGYYDNVDARHILMLNKALSKTPKSFTPSLSGAESSETNRNIFNALAAGDLWTRLTAFIANSVVSPAKELTSEDQDRIHEANSPAMPPEFHGISFQQFLENKTLRAPYLKYVKQTDEAFVPSSSQVARILIGKAGSELEAENETSKFISIANNIPEEEEQGVADDSSDNEEDPVDEGTKDEDLEDDTEDINTADKEESGKRPKDEMTENSNISLVITCSGNKMRCHVEAANRSMIDSNVFMLTGCFAEWVNNSHSDILQRKFNRPLFKTQKELLDILTKISGKNKAMKKKVMSEFAKRAVLYWEDAYLPVRALFENSGHLWACKRCMPSFKRDICVH
jgi:hypothetical protein